MKKHTDKIVVVENLKKRTKEFVVRSTKLYRSLPKTGEARIFGDQFLRAAASVGSNYRASCRARSQNEFFSKISIVVEEADEVLFWLEIMMDTGIFSTKKVMPLYNEGSEILSIVAKARSNVYK